MMKEQVKNFIKKMLPAHVVSGYHLFLTSFAAFACGNPSRKMLVIGVTGTKGKSTTSLLLARVFEQTGYCVGVTSTAMFKVGPEEWINDTKMTMLGRFALQRLLQRMVDAKCDVAIVETSSEGMKQWRHAGIAYDAAVFTNLSPEHIESHGSFEKYKETKGRLFAALATSSKKILRGKEIPKIIIANSDDEHASYFLSFPADKHLSFGMKEVSQKKNDVTHLQIKNVVLTEKSSRFEMHGVPVETHLLGSVNVMNAAAALTVGFAYGVPLETGVTALRDVQGIPGRFERIEEGQPYTVIVDYAHEPKSFAQLYEAATFLPHTRIIHVFGSTGGGRDKSRRPVLGAIAGKNADVVVVTMDDPYDEDPQAINDAVVEGAESVGKVRGKNLFDIVEREAAIQFAMSIAKPGDLVLVTGKGSEQRLVLAHGNKIPWDDRSVVRAAIHSHGQK